jgi:hypothetical protein
MDGVMTRAALRGWLPVRVAFRDGLVKVEWANFAGKKLAEPFFRDSAQIAMRLPFNQAFRCETPADEMVEWATSNPGIAPTAFVFHASRCGSTLVSQMLASLPSHIVVSEPPMLDSLLRAQFFVGGLTEEKQLAYIRALISAIGQPRFGESRLVVKLDAWNIFERALIRRAFPDTPWIFLYRDPLEIAVSQVRQRASYMVPGLIGPSQWMIDHNEALAMAEEEYIARILGGIFQQGVAMMKEPGADSSSRMALHYNQLPAAMWQTHREMFGVTDDEQNLVAMQNAAKWDAKNPYFEFTNDAEQKQREATPQLRDAVAKWVQPYYLELERLRNG